MLVLTNTIALAAPGDIIHTGLKKVYRKGVDDNLLVEDVLDPSVDKKGFYREVEVDGEVKFVNIVDEEEAHEGWILEHISKDLDLTNEDAVKEYILSQVDKLEKITEEIAKDFDESWAEMTWEEYQSYNNAPKLKASDNYSIPEPGFKEGSTKIATLKLPTGASKWQIQISDNEIPAMKKDTPLGNGKNYVSGRDIDIDVGKYLVLYAVDKDNKIKAFENIKIDENMINTPKELAAQIKSGKISEGKKYTGSVVINELNELPEGAAKWQVLISPIPVEKVYKVKMADAIDYIAGDDVIVAKENELHPIADSFKKYLVLLAVDKEGIVQGYNTFEIGKGDISKAPSLLVENTHYKGPVPGDKDGTTKFTDLNLGINRDENMKDATSWKVLVSKKAIPLPKLDSGAEGTKLSVPNEIEASIGDYLLLAAVDNGDKIKGYRIFHLTENMVKGETAPELEEDSDKNYSLPSKGTVQGTTKIDYLNRTGIVGATKWMYKIGENLADPIFNKIVEGSSDYTAGQNVKANAGEDFLLLATDNEGRVKAFAKIKLDGDMIKDPPPVLLKEGVNYVGPVKGDNPGTTKFEALSGSASIGDKPEWMYVISDEMPDIPELDKEVEGAKELKAKDSIDVNLSSDKYLMLLATKNSKVKGYAIFRLGEYNIRMSSATLLKEDTHYSDPKKGTAPGTTRITELNFEGIEDAGQWRYKISREAFLESEETIEFNTIIPQTAVYNKGNNIRAEAEDYLLLLATDGSGKIKGYKQFKLKKSQVTKPNAPLLLPRTNYTEPEAGSVENSTKFRFLDFSTNIKGTDKWQYVIGDKSFGNIELDSMIEKAGGFKSGEDIKDVSNGDYLLLLATDGSGKVKGYREFRLTERNIRGGPAKELKLDENYVLEKGNRPGTTKFTKLMPLGMEGNINWKYKLMNSTLPNDGKPYLNSVIEDINFINIGQDIEVKKIEDGYGYLLLLAVDGSGRTKGYAEIKIDPNKVKEHAPLWEVALDRGSVVDSVQITGTKLEDGTTAKYIRGYRPFPTPAVDEILLNGIEYNLGDDITQIRIGEHIGIYAVDKDNKIKKFNSLEVTQDKIKQGKAEITDTAPILEGSINNGGEKIIIELSDGAKWANDLKTNADKRQTLYSGFKANSEPQEWTKVVASLVKDGSGAISLNEDNTKLTISLPETKDYDITKDQEITLTVPAITIEGATNPIDASGEITIKPTVKATISGDVVNSVVREGDIKAGGKTIVVELKDGDWAEDVSSIVSGFSGGDNWGKIAGQIKNKNIVRNSSKKLTITLPKVSGVSFGVDKEIVSLTIPQKLVQGANTDIVATPKFTLYPNVLQVAGEAVENTVYLEAPDGRAPLKDKDIWKIKVNTGTLKSNITDKDIVVSGLPRGLKANVVGVDTENNIITIKVSGTAAAKVDNMEVNIKIKGSAVEEPNSLDSENIKLNLEMNDSKVLDDVKYRLQYNEDKLNVYLVDTDNDMEYSIDSTNGINGKWEEASSGEFLIGEASPMKIWVREKAQPKVFYQVADLKYGDTPVDVKINSYNYDSSELEIILKGYDTSSMQYSINGGGNWLNLDSPTIPVKLDSSSDLRIRYKAITGTDQSANLRLPSLPTKKLNGIYLGNVELNVAEGIIENTTTNMEYSTDGNRYTQAKNGNTPVNFVKDTEIWIRERGKGNEINFRNLGQVKQMEFIQTELDSISYDINKGTIIGGTGYEYKIANDPWKDVDDGKNIAFKPGSLQFRKKGNKENLPSETREKAIIAPQAPAPNLSYDDINRTVEKIGTSEGANYEYSLDGGINWTSGEKDTQFEAGNEIKIRIKATEDKLPSQTQTIKFTPNLPFDNVYLDAGKSMIMNTTAEMEYSLNSTDGLGGQWYKASSPNTNIPLKEKMNVWIREAKKPKNNRKLGNGSMAEKELADLGPIGFSIANQTISINTSGKDISKLQKIVDDLQYRIAGGNWINIPYTKLEPNKINILAYNVAFEPGKLEFRLKGDMDYLPSKSLTKYTIKAKASAPNVVIDYMDEKISSISNGETTDWKYFEYNIDNGPWINGEYLKTENLSGEKTLNIRTKATNDKLPSQVAVIKLKEKLPLEHVILSTHVKTLELNGTTTQMEYRVNNVEWKKCDKDNTKLTKRDGSYLNDINIVNIIEIRDSEQPKNVYVVYK